MLTYPLLAVSSIYNTRAVVTVSERLRIAADADTGRG